MKTEHLTRKEIIDSRLRKAGWNLDDRSQVLEEYEIKTDTDTAHDPSSPYAGHQYSDYVLLGKNGKPVAVIEAKKTSCDAAIGREQAKQYCQNILKNSGGTAIRSFTRKFNTHPAIIIGRLQYDELIPYSLGRQFFKPVEFK